MDEPLVWILALVVLFAFFVFAPGECKCTGGAAAMPVDPQLGGCAS